MMKKKGFIIGSVILLFGSIFLLTWFFWPKKEKKLQINKTELKEVKQKIDLKILRYDLDLYSLNQNQLEVGIKTLSEKYPRYLIDEKAFENPQMISDLKKYLNDPIIKDLYNQVFKLFSNFNPYENEIKDAFSHYLLYFPDHIPPPIITMVPGLDLQMPSVYIFDHTIYLNLDLYLGKEYPIYSKMGIPKYISERMEPQFISIDIFKKGLVYQHLPEQSPVTLLESMIIEGKKLYFTEMMLPQKPLADLIGYSVEKWDWAEKFYPNVWGYFIENNLLFSKEEEVFRKYIDETPFSKPFGNSSPGRMGQFLGWKIVKAYMENNPDVTLIQLMQETDLQMILNKSAFKPIIKK
ncbi:MAG TPA: DUF2268 domain-containing putative Zn-dependent protease [Bacteroidales bacterium]|nr:DUF2268 domain-containing putative Zn-dependent protease [Bacteroidales bacterium]